jgi:FkbM family methyltransferase
MSISSTSQRALAAAGGLFRRSGERSRFLRRCYSAGYFFYKRHWEDPYASLTARHPEFFAGGDILDVGANIGYTATLFASVCSPGFTVHAFEPEDANAILLRENLDTARCAVPCRVVQAAVGAEAGRADLWFNFENPSDHRIVQGPLAAQIASTARRNVPMVSIDSYLESTRAPQIAFIKVDVQGYELPVCRGMAQTLASHPEAIVGLEYCPQAFASLGYDGAAVLDFFGSRGYRVFELTRAAFGPWEPSRSAALRRRGYTDLVFIGPARGVSR